MASTRKTHKHKSQDSEENESNLLALKPADELLSATELQVHRLGEEIICMTDYRARKRSPTEIVLDATEGFIPLWAENLVLRWRFNEASLAVFQQPETIKEKIRDLFGKAILAWGDAAPVRFTENSDNSDFEIVMKQNDSCTPQGCPAAQSFFPDAGRHQLLIFPKVFEKSNKEQIDTLTHEIGHIFGLRHFFAPELETSWPSIIFGTHKPFSIMNYGSDSELTDEDRNDLKKLYESVWSRQLTKINGTPIKLVQSYHYLVEG